MTRSTDLITSSTECGWPVPRLYASERPAASMDCQRPDVGIRQVAHVNVVAEAGAIRCRIVVAEDLQAPAQQRPRWRGESNGFPANDPRRSRRPDRRRPR